MQLALCSASGAHVPIDFNQFLSQCSSEMKFSCKAHIIMLNLYPSNVDPLSWPIAIKTVLEKVLIQAVNPILCSLPTLCLFYGQRVEKPWPRFLPCFLSEQTIAFQILLPFHFGNIHFSFEQYQWLLSIHNSWASKLHGKHKMCWFIMARN